MNEFLEQVHEENPHALQVDGYDDCCIGIVRRCGFDPLALYSIDKIVAKMMVDDDMSEEEAVEFFDYNIIGSWVGVGTPCFT